MFKKSTLDESEFSWQSALNLAMASQLAYHTVEEGVSHVATKTWGFDECRSFAKDDTQGFVAWDDSKVLVSFRGSEANLGDWVGNLRALPTSRPFGRVHKGFSRGFEDVRDQLQGILAETGPSGKSIWLTGHSLGGALAVMMAAEFLDDLDITGIYTYGQPKVVGGQASKLFRENYARKFQRFVNDDDIVPKVPPGYRHVGDLFWFDKNGGLKSAPDGMTEAESTRSAEVPEELTEEEFEALQKEILDLAESIREVEADAAEGEEGATRGGASELDMAVEGLFPSFADHALTRYIQKIRKYVTFEAELDPTLESAVAASAMGAEGTEGTRSTLRSGPESVPVILRVRHSKWKAPENLNVQSRLGSIVSAKVALKDLEKLRETEGVISIDVSREAGTEELANSIPFVRGNEIQAPASGDEGEKGDSVIIGIIDTGIDILHPAFLDENGKTRILAVWNQRSGAGESPKEVDPETYFQSYGNMIGAEQIQRIVDNQEQPHRWMRDPGNHGTHVASIAAGRAVGDFAGGMAPEAKIVVVIPDMVTELGAPQSIGYSSSHIDALGFMRSMAEREELPISVNVSLGMNAGAHDGSSALEAAFDAFSGSGRDPGFAIIKSAGNERGHKGHARGDAMLGGASEISWDSAPGGRSLDYIEAWFSALDQIEFRLVDPQGRESDPVNVSNPSLQTELGDNFCQLTLSPFHGDNGDSQLVIEISADVVPIQGGTWKLKMLGQQILMDGRVDAWVEREDRRAVNFLTGDNDEMTLSIPGTAQSVICVSASGSELPLVLTDTSSWGLTRDGRAKPDICAPGTEIIAAKANSSGGKTTSKTGTSMAAPHVAGAVALLFSSLHKDDQRKQVNANQVRAALIKSAKNSTGRHNRGFGFGALDVAKLFEQF